MNFITIAFRYGIRHAAFAGVVFLLTGIIAFNKQFAYISIGNLYITEFVSALLILLGITKFVIHRKSYSISKVEVHTFIETFWPLILITIYALVTIYLDRSYGFQTLRHSLIFLYTIVFLLLFCLSIDNTRQLKFILIYLVVIFSALFNGIKLIVYKYLGYSFHFEEQERVLHNETDIICASLSLLGLIVYHNFFWKKSKVLTMVLAILNLLIIILAIKRSALAGILPAVVLYFFLTRNSFHYKKAIRIIFIASLIIMSAMVIWYVVDAESWVHYKDYFVHKLSFSEKNASWRWQAWQIAFDKFLTAPYFGIGYGENIISFPLQGTDTHDPHNSILAFLVRHGMIVFALFILFISKTYASLFDLVKKTPKENPEYHISIFLMLGLTTMIFFAFFNVVLENQYEGIFFNLFLCGLYVLQKQRSPVFQFTTSINNNVLNGVALGVIAIFILIASWGHPVDRLNLYSAKTNTSLPLPFEGEFKHFEVIPRKDIGVTIKQIDYAEYEDPLISWFFPPKALDFQLEQYELVVEYDRIVEGIKYELEYEDGFKLPLKIKKKGQHVTMSLEGISPVHGKAKIKLFSLMFPHFDRVVIKNIYLNRINKE